MNLLFQSSEEIYSNSTLQEDLHPHCPWKCELTNEVGYVVYSALGSFYIPMFVMLFFYWRIYRAAVRTTRAINQGFRTTKGTKIKQKRTQLRNSAGFQFDLMSREPGRRHQSWLLDDTVFVHSFLISESRALIKRVILYASTLFIGAFCYNVSRFVQFITFPRNDINRV